MSASGNNPRAVWLEGPSAVCPAPTELTHCWRVILLGAPGVGKGTQADLLRQRLSACHLSTGDIFRAAARRNDGEQTPAMLAALDFMRCGALVSDVTVWDLVRERSTCLRCRGGFILDGFPRTLLQAELLKRLMEEEQIALDAVVNYELPISEVVERLGGRRTCEKCKAVYHIIRQPSQVEGICDRCGGRLFQRDDDRPASVTVRMEAYERSTAPLIDFYRDLGLLLPIPATGTPEEICTGTVAALERRSNSKTA